MARASGGANNMRPLSWGGGTNGKDPLFLCMLSRMSFCVVGPVWVGRWDEIGDDGGEPLDQIPTHVQVDRVHIPRGSHRGRN